MMSEFLNREETAKTLRLSVRTIDSLIGRGEITVRRVGRRVLIPADEVKRFAGGVSGSAEVNSAKSCEGEVAPAVA
jgi:excisionase family DNA binding protein